MGRIGAGVIATLSELAFLPPVRKLQNLRGGILPTGIIKFTNTLSLLLLSFFPSQARYKHEATVFEVFCVLKNAFCAL